MLISCGNPLMEWLLGDVKDEDGVIHFSIGSFTDFEKFGMQIAEGGNNKKYVITFTADIPNMPGKLSTDSTFGDFIGITVTIIGNGNTLTLNTAGNLFCVGAGQTVIIQNLNLSGYSTNNASLVYLASGATFTMQSSSSISQNNVGTTNCGGVYVESGAVFNMKGGTISDNSVDSGSGGGVYVDNGGTFNMTGGSIFSNHATNGGNGGGVYVAGGGTFNMTSGMIGVTTPPSGNDAANGGGVYVADGGTFNMTGGSITNNTALHTPGSGGGVYVESGPGGGGTFNLNSLATIDNNIGTPGYGKQIYVDSPATFRKGGILQTVPYVLD